MIHLSQQDPRWAKVTLGDSPFIISRYGCTTTAISMLSDYFKGFQPPDALAKTFAKYTMAGLIIWQGLTLPTTQFEVRINARDDQSIMRSLKDPNGACILNVNNGAHWVVAIGKVPFFNDYWIVDPWDAKVKRACATYKNIVGSAHFKHK